LQDVLDLGLEARSVGRYPDLGRTHNGHWLLTYLNGASSVEPKGLGALGSNDDGGMYCLCESFGVGDVA
jgi:hypothetical protein